MATKEQDWRTNGVKGKGLCNCCDSPNCGKRKGPYPRKRTPYLEGQKKRVSWRPQGCPNVYCNDYILSVGKSK